MAPQKNAKEQKPSTKYCDPPSSLARPKPTTCKRIGQIDEACLARATVYNEKKVICMNQCCGVYGHPPTHFMNSCSPCTQSYCGPYGCYWG